MTDLLILPVGLLAGAGFWWLCRALLTWVETGRFRSVRRG